MWGNAFFQSLREELIYNPAQTAKIPEESGALLLSIIPVLQVLATISLRTRARCLRYINHQICLIDDKIAQAVSRKSAADKQTTREFRSFKEHYLTFKTQLLDMDPSREESSLNDLQQNWVDKVHIYFGA